MKFRKLQPKKLRGVALMFFGAGGLGIAMGLLGRNFYMVMIGTVFICIGGLVGWMLLTGRHKRDSRKKRRDGDPAPG